MDLVGGTELFEYVFLLSFGLCSLGIGVVTAKFGSGVSRKIGVITAIIGIIFIGIFYAVADGPVEVLQFTIVSGLGAMLGGILGLGIFLVAIMKS